KDMYICELYNDNQNCTVQPVINKTQNQASRFFFWFLLEIFIDIIAALNGPKIKENGQCARVNCTLESALNSTHLMVVVKFSLPVLVTARCDSAASYPYHALSSGMEAFE